MNIKIVTENNSADVNVGQRRNEGGIGDDGKNGRMRSTMSSSKLKKPPPSSDSPTCQTEFDSMDLVYPCQALAFDILYNSHLHALLIDEASNSSSKSEKVRRPMHILPDDEESISSISNNQNEEDNRIEAEGVEISEFIDNFFCGGFPGACQDLDLDSSHDLDDLIMGEGGVEAAGALKLLNDWVQLNDHAGIGDELGEGRVQHHEEGDKKVGRKEVDERQNDPRLSEDEVPFRVLTITTPTSSSGNNTSQSLNRHDKSATTEVVSARKCSCTIM